MNNNSFSSVVRLIKQLRCYRECKLLLPYTTKLAIKRRWHCMPQWTNVIPHNNDSSMVSRVIAYVHLGRDATNPPLTKRPTGVSDLCIQGSDTMASSVILINNSDTSYPRVNGVLANMCFIFTLTEPCFLISYLMLSVLSRFTWGAFKWRHRRMMLILLIKLLP